MNTVGGRLCRRRSPEKSQEKVSGNVCKQPSRVLKNQSLNLEILSIDCEVHVETIVKYGLKNGR